MELRADRRLNPGAQVSGGGGAGPARADLSLAQHDKRRDGPDAAHRSTTTVRDAASANVASSASAIQGSGWWQFPQSGMPAVAAGTRLRRPRFGQVTSSVDVAWAGIGQSWFS
jgi:hypothetical protein